MTTAFAEATAVNPIEPTEIDARTESGAVVPGVRQDFAAAIAVGWDIAGNTNGGYLLAIVARALAAATQRPDPVTMTAHYLAPGRPGPALVHTELAKVGKRFSTASATMSAADRATLAVLGTFGELPAPGEVPPPLHVAGEPPELPAPEACVGLDEVGGDAPPFMHRIELLLHPDDARFASGSPSGTPRFRGWFRLRDDEPMDTVALLCAVDAFPPTVFNASFPVAWTPTIELTAHIRARPAPGWLACNFATRFVTGDFLEVDGEVWDATGTLVAQSRQLALLPRG